MNANVASSPSTASHSLEADDEECARERSDDDDAFEEDDDGERTPGATDSQIDDFEWDELDATPGPSGRFLHEGPGELLPVPEGGVLLSSTDAGVPASPRASPPIPRPATEVTPLLRKAVSFSQEPHPYHREQRENETGTVVKQRRPSASSAKSVKYVYSGKSTFGQTVSGDFIV